MVRRGSRSSEGYIAMEPSEDRGGPSHHRGPRTVERGDPAVERGDPAVEPGELSVERGEASRKPRIVRANRATTVSAGKIDRRFRQFFVLANNSCPSAAGALPARRRSGRRGERRAEPQAPCTPGQARRVTSHPFRYAACCDAVTLEHQRPRRAISPSSPPVRRLPSVARCRWCTRPSRFRCSPRSRRSRPASRSSFRYAGEQSGSRERPRGRRDSTRMAYPSRRFHTASHSCNWLPGSSTHTSGCTSSVPAAPRTSPGSPASRG